ncbi:sensor histidine kinase, partial [Escherichia coli]|nr:sensor histidine kinase [Escherichia coli]
CKHTLQQLVRAAEADRRQAIEEQSAAEWLESVLRRWHLMRPEASYRYQCLGLGSAPRLTSPTDLSQALLNLLNNAADACPDDLDIRLD